jgi:hypothetical protein
MELIVNVLIYTALIAHVVLLGRLVRAVEKIADKLDEKHIRSGEERSGENQ